MSLRFILFAASLTTFALPALAAADAQAGRDLVLRSCASCHALNASSRASDSAPPLSFLAKDNKARPAWVRGWLMDPHPPMPNIMLNRAQIDNIIAYLNTLPTD
jgi:mono/diheme cytochrome c family protein